MPIHQVAAPPKVLPRVATDTAGQNSSGVSLTSPNTTGSEPRGSSVAETNAVANTALKPNCGKANQCRNEETPAAIQSSMTGLCGGFRGPERRQASAGLEWRGRCLEAVAHRRRVDGRGEVEARGVGVAVGLVGHGQLGRDE